MKLIPLSERWMIERKAVMRYLPSLRGRKKNTCTITWVSENGHTFSLGGSSYAQLREKLIVFERDISCKIFDATIK